MIKYLNYFGTLLLRFDFDIPILNHLIAHITKNVENFNDFKMFVEYQITLKGD